MSDSNYNKIISTINSVSRDYTYSPDPNNLICIDTSNNRIGINTLDPEVSLHISGGSIRIGGDISASGNIGLVGDLRVNNIYANVISASRYGTSIGQSSVISATNITATNNIDASSIVVTNIIDISRGRIRANFIDISSTLDISRGRIMANNIDVSAISVSSILDISKGLILANTISGSAITINVNANASSDIITINIGNSNGVKIITATNSNANDITINGVRLATTQHIRNAIPVGVIMAYYTTPAPPGWAICDGSNGTPDLRGRFILGGGIRTGTGGIITTDNTYVYHMFLNIGSHTFTPLDSGNVDLLIVGGGSSGGIDPANGVTTGGKGGDVIIITGLSVSTGINYSIVVGNGGSHSIVADPPAFIPYLVKGPGQNSSFDFLTASGGTTNFLGRGQSGTESSILGQSYYWGGAGGRPGEINTTGIGGLGGGGGSARTNGREGQIGGVGFNNGGTGDVNGGNGGANTGGGGGGDGGGGIGGGGLPGSGGSGIVVVRYPISNRINTNGSVGGTNYFLRESLGLADAYVDTTTSSGGALNTTVPHNNMPPFYVLVYIMKTTDYDFCYNLL
jgi:hypothetical protein